jgi:integral membrane sensor domain MASE1
MRVLPTQHLKDLLLPILGLAIVYAVVGRLSLLLAIPPGYSMAVYPPAGIALGMVLTGGYRLLPGVALGSFLVNLFVSFENFGQINNAAILLSTLLALGASLQAGVSAYLIKRLTRSELILDNQKIILRFFLYGGLIGCLISASVGIFSLYTLGILPASAIISNWLTWWMGDTFGVLTITPIVLILFARPKKI